MSADGQHWVISSRGFFAPSIAAIWVSNDYGVTFTNVGGSGSSTAMSQNGKTIMVDGNISTDYGSTFTSVVPSYSQVAINR
jgi:hypothetical protein